MDYKEYCVSGELTILDAMKKLDIVEPKILFIVADGVLQAALTDGDIRRFLMGGGKLTDPASKAGNNNPFCAESEEGASALYHYRNYVAIPIVDKKRRIIDVFVGKKKEQYCSEPLCVPVVINAGGRGTRLEPYTKVLPKPLVPVGELPIIEHIMKEFIKYGCNQFHVIVNYKKEIMKAYFADNEEKYSITWYDEKIPLGTGGGLCYLKGILKETFFFTNCDNLLLSNYESMLRFHKENGNVITMVCSYKTFTIPYGVVDMGLNGSILQMREKPELSFLTNTGIYIVEPEVLEDVEDDTAVDFPDILERQRLKGKKVAVYPVSENEWLDMGQHSELEKMRERLYERDACKDI